MKARAPIGFFVDDVHRSMDIPLVCPTVKQYPIDRFAVRWPNSVFMDKITPASERLYDDSSVIDRTMIDKPDTLRTLSKKSLESFFGDHMRCKMDTAKVHWTPMITSTYLRLTMEQVPLSTSPIPLRKCWFAGLATHLAPERSCFNGCQSSSSHVICVCHLSMALSMPAVGSPKVVKMLPVPLRSMGVSIL